MDELDKKIVYLLVGNGRTSNNEIARVLSVSEGTVRHRVRRMIDNNELKIAGLMAPEAVVDKELVLLGVKVAMSKDLSAIAARISQLPEVQASYITTGRYDIIVEALLTVKYGPIDFLCGPLSGIDGIVSTETFMVMKSFNKWIIPQLEPEDSQ
ncbi:MAG: Lrp/AsnC family transcriptional regulator [Victivallales bacterium]|nr:Lrp/AsnC family transcriptional regulator [Victivallales bacterium]